MMASLIITTYNWPEALALTLASVLDQRHSDFEVIVADDGSRADTGQTVARVLGRSNLTWRHVRHGDDGIRQARIKNLAVGHATGDYFIFIDHDVVLHPDFIGDHLAAASQGCFLQGKRVFLSPERTARAMAAGSFTPPAPWARGLENRKNGLRAPALGRLMGRPKRFQRTLRGCNLSMARETYMAADGYDEVFDGLWGREDSDICYRLFNQGIRIRNLWLAGLQYHLHHPSIKRRQRDRLDEELDRCLQEKRTRAIKGYSKMDVEGELVGGSTR